MQLHELLCPDYFPDWEDDECKCYIYYHYKKNEWCCDNIQYMKEFIVYFNAKAAKRLAKFSTERSLWWKVYNTINEMFCGGR